jgi:hypothetical protein
MQSTKEMSMFTLFGLDHTILCQAHSPSAADRWVRKLREGLEPLHTPGAWTEKCTVAGRVAQMNQDLIASDIDRYTDLIFSIASTGLFSASVISPDYAITGVMRVLSSEDSTSRDWQDMYCVMSESCILVFESSVSRAPAGVIILKFASVYMHHGALRSGRHIFVVQTPLRKYYFSAKHEVALAEWLFAIERTLGGTRAASSVSYLRLIHRIAWQDYHMIHILEKPHGRHALHRYLTETKNEQGLALLNDWRVFNKYLSFSSSVTPAQRYELKGQLLAQLDGREYQAPELMSLKLNDDEAYDYSLSVEQLTQLRTRSLETANALHDALFNNFTNSVYYEPCAKAFTDATRKHRQMISEAEEGDDKSTGDEAEDPAEKSSVESASNRAAFDPIKHCLTVEWTKVKENGQKGKNRTHLFPRGRSSLSIGRASTNDVRISDAGISRTHARIEWGASPGVLADGCVIIDLGSTFGTKVNGVSITRTRLNVGDRIQCGKSTVITLAERAPSSEKCVIC